MQTTSGAPRVGYCPAPDGHRALSVGAVIVRRSRPTALAAA